MFLKSRTYSLKLSLSAAFFSIVLVTSIILGISSYFVSKSYFRSNFEEKLRNLVSTVSAFVPAAQHSQIKTADDENSENYKQIKKILQNFKKTNPDLRFVYTMRKVGDQIQFVVDAEEPDHDMSHVGDVYDKPTEALNKALTGTSEVQVEEDFSSDQWGTWQSGFAPLFTADGKFDGIVGIDVAAQEILAHEHQLALLAIVCSLVTLLFAVIFSSIIASRISDALTSLSNEVHKVENLDLSDNQAPSTSIREIIYMSSAIDGMKKGLRSFKKFVPADIVIELMKHKKEAVLGADKRPLTILFSDIADFTTISEKLSSEELSANLGRYLQCLSHIIKDHSGTIDKFIGDAIMAFWGAPNADVDHARHACTAALKCQQELQVLNAQLVKEGFPAFHTRIGINTGDCIVGNMGHEDRLSYTAIGDHVNMASRVESINKMYGTHLLITENTWSLVKDHFEARAIDSVVVKGKTKALVIYELVAEKNNISAAEKKYLQDFNLAFSLLNENKIEAAQSAFQMLALARPKDTPTQLALERIAKSKQSSGSAVNPRILKTK